MNRAASIVAIIPARSGSKGIPNKNLAMCAGRPLIEWTLMAVESSSLVTRSVVSTDILDMSDYAYARHMIVLHDSINDDAQIENRIDTDIMSSDDIIVLLQPTSPIRTGKQIDEAIEQLHREKADSLVSVVESHAFTWSQSENSNPFPSYDYANRPRRQDVRPHYRENGSIYVFTRKHWEKTHCRLGGKVSLYEMPQECSYEIDTPFDLWLVEQILQHQGVLVG